MTELAVTPSRRSPIVVRATKAIRFIRAAGFGAYFLRTTGLDASPRRDSRARFRRFVFAVRALLIPMTLLLFLVPQPTYKATPARWLALGGLVIWLAFFAKVVEREWAGKRWFPVYLTDLIVVFTLFGVSFASDSRNATSGYSGVLLRGSFHPQTFGPFLTAGAMLGARRALTLGVVGSAFYVSALLAAGIHTTTLVNDQQLPSLAFGVAGYLVAGGLLGVYSTLLEMLRAANEKGRTVGRTLGRREVEAEVHDKVLTPVRTVQRHLAHLSQTSRDKSAKARIGAVATYLDLVLKRERANRGLSEARTQTLTQVALTAYWNQRMFDDDQRMCDLSFRPARFEADQDGIPLLNERAAIDLEEILFEAIENAMVHSRGEIKVSLERSETHRRTDHQIVVEDGGRAETGSDAAGLGVANMKRRAAANGWSAHLDLGNDRSVFTLSLPDPIRRQPFRTFATPGIGLRLSGVVPTFLRRGAAKVRNFVLSNRESP
jgi:two-component sensor histidine kinase